MTPSADEPQGQDPTASPEHRLLQASLERTLSAEERQQLLAAARNDPAVVDDIATYALLRALRLEQRMARHEAPAWDRFQELARQHAAGQPASGWARWLAWLRRQPGAPGLSVPRLAAACAAVVIALQAGGLVWLAQRPAEHAVMRGGDGLAMCPAVLVRLKPQASASDFARVLMQSQARVVDGPDAQGAFRVIGPAGFAEEAGALFTELAQDVRPAADCPR